MTVKPWQKAALSVMTGATVYAGVLYVLTMQTQERNQTIFVERRQAVAREKALEKVFQEKKQSLIALENKLHAEEESTAKLDAKIKSINAEIAQIKAGRMPNSVSIPAVSVPQVPKKTSAVANIQAPPVQSVTRASGV